MLSKIICGNITFTVTNGLASCIITKTYGGELAKWPACVKLELDTYRRTLCFRQINLSTENSAVNLRLKNVCENSLYVSNKVL